MVERNMLGEGFIRNTLNELGTISGSQVVSIPEMNDLIDEDFTTTALTVSGSFFTSLDADMGARWKLDRIELYTNEPSSANFTMSVSTDNTEFFLITMTGSAGLWLGSVSGTTVSGAPRYIRYEQRPSVDRTVQEWRAINDDSLVDFGADGTQTEVEIDDSPIGKPSDQVTELKLFNRFEKTAQGFVFIDKTGDKADDNIEIALSANGPFFGRLTQTSNQPDNLKWTALDNSSNAIGARSRNNSENRFVPVSNAFSGLEQQDFVTNLVVLSGIAYRVDFGEGRLRGWSTTGFTSNNIAAGTFRGNLSTTTTPKYFLNQVIGDNQASSPDSAPAISNGFLPFRAEDYDTSVLVLTNPGTVTPSDHLEGPRLFWRNHSMTAFDTEHSAVSTTSGQIGNGAEQTLTFDLSNVTTWSGVISSVQIQPWTTSTGIGFTSSITSLEIFKDGINKADRLALEPEIPISGSWIGFNSGSFTGQNDWIVAINTENVIKDPCIITSVSTPGRFSETRNDSGWFLCRFRDGFDYQDSDIQVNEPSADPFIVKEIALMDESHEGDAQVVSAKKPVYWHAEPGDMIGYAYHAFDGGVGQGPIFRFDTNLTATVGGALAIGTFMDIDDGIAALQTDMNASTNWFTTGKRPNIQFRSVPYGPYLSSGTYLTPIFDGGGDPALLQFEFESVEENGTSIDVDGNATLKTIDTRASITPPNTRAGLGTQKQQFMLGAHTSDQPSRFDPKYTSNYVIGLMNPEVEAREQVTSTSLDTQIGNTGSNAFYHEEAKELWVLNINISGTVNTDMRPIWDRYDIDADPPNYLGTQHMTGDIAYTHDNNTASAAANVFEPVGWIPDYDRGEIYIITRENEFVIGNGRYNGIIMTTGGEYVDVFWRNDQLTQDIVDGSFAANTTIADQHLQNMRTVTYRAPYFYALTSPIFGEDDATHINVYRLGNNPSDADNPNDVEFITHIDLGTVPGLTTITVSSPVDTMCYVSSNDLFYFIKDDGDDIFTFQAAVTGSPPSESVTIVAGPITETTADLFAEDALVEDFSPFVSFANIIPWRGSSSDQQLKRMMDLVYCVDRDSLIHMLSYQCVRTRDFVREGQFNDNDYFWHFHNFTVMVEYGADTVGTKVETPALANKFDPIWGTISGSLPFEQVAENSLLFPTGRYAQLKYQFNSDSEQLNTPYLVSSRVNQGITVGDIPSSGTTSIFLRTNIPETETIGDQTGKLKIFWQLKEC